MALSMHSASVPVFVRNLTPKEIAEAAGISQPWTWARRRGTAVARMRPPGAAILGVDESVVGRNPERAGRLHLTAYFRSHDIFRAWPIRSSADRTRC